jgi:hypothetical protein
VDVKKYNGGERKEKSENECATQYSPSFLSLPTILSLSPSLLTRAY